MGTLKDIEEHWSMSDVYDAIDYLDLLDDAEMYEYQKNSNKG